MLVMTLIYLIGPIVCCLINVIIGKNNKKLIRRSLYLLFAFAVLTYIKTYFNLPSRNLLSIICGTGFWGAVYESIVLSLTTGYSLDEKQYKRIVVTIGAFTGILLVGWIGEIHSMMSVKPVWNSISKEYSKSSEAPTFKRNETPVALAPNTVLNRVRKSMSDIPNSQYFEAL